MVNFALPAKTHRKIKAMAAAEGWSMKQFLHEAIDSMIRGWEPSKLSKNTAKTVPQYSSRKRASPAK